MHSKNDRQINITKVCVSIGTGTQVYKKFDEVSYCLVRRLLSSEQKLNKSDMCRKLQDNQIWQRIMTTA